MTQRKLKASFYREQRYLAIDFARPMMMGEEGPLTMSLSPEQAQRLEDREIHARLEEIDVLIFRILAARYPSGMFHDSFSQTHDDNVEGGMLQNFIDVLREMYPTSQQPFIQELADHKTMTSYIYDYLTRTTLYERSVYLKSTQAEHGVVVKKGDWIRSLVEVSKPLIADIARVIANGLVALHNCQPYGSYDDRERESLYKTLKSDARIALLKQAAVVYEQLTQ